MCDLKLGIRRKLTKKKGNVPNPVSITGNQVDNLPNISSSFRIISVRCLLLLLLILSLVCLYGTVIKKGSWEFPERIYAWNLYSQPLLACPWWPRSNLFV